MHLINNLKKRKSVLWSSLGVIAGDAPNFGPGVNVLLDVPTPALGVLTLSGATLRNYGNASASITADSIVNGGSIIFEGNGGTPYTGQLDITLTGQPVAGRTVGHNATTTANDNNGANRALLMMPGSVTRLRGAWTTNHQAKLQQTGTALKFPAGATTLTLDRAVTWKKGQRIAIGVTGFTPPGTANRTEIFTLASDAVGNTITLTTGLGFDRFAQVQYGNDASANVSQVVNGYTIMGLSTTPGPTATKPDATTPSSIDCRANVMLLDRNITVKGANDSNWTNSRFGGHCMVMGLNSEAVIDGVLFERMGQGGTLGRYPWHWHMPSYDINTGATLGDYGPNKALFQNNAILNSANRACTLHGVRGAVVRSNSAVGIYGHAFFLEDGSEMNNTIDSNLAYKIDDPGPTYQIKFHDGAASGYWISNAGNTVTNNVVGDAIRGVWYAPNGANTGDSSQWNAFTSTLGSSYVGGCFGLSKKVPIYPQACAPNLNGHVWDNNTGHSCQQYGALSNDFAVDEDGNTTQGLGIGRTTLDGRPESQGGVPVVMEFKGTTVWKNLGGAGYSNRVPKVQYTGFRGADNPGDVFQGQVSLLTPQSFSDSHFLIGRSLNVETPPAGWADFYCGFATYHGLLIFRNIWGFNFKDSAPQIFSDNVRASALSESWDLYIDPVQNYFALSTGWVLQNAIPMFRTPPPHIWANYSAWITGVGSPQAGYDEGGGFIRWGHYTLSGAFYDPAGTLSGDPSRVGHYIIYDHPYLTQGLTTQAVLPSYSKTVTTPTPFYGIKPYNSDSQAGPQYRFSTLCSHMFCQQVNRADNSAIAGAVWDIPSEWGQKPYLQGSIDGDRMFSPGFNSEYPHGLAAGTNGAGTPSPGPFHHFAVAKGQRVLMSLLNEKVRPLKSIFATEIHNMQLADDALEFGIEWDGTVPPNVDMQGLINLTSSGRSVGSLAAFNALTHSGYWHDTANNKLWIRLDAVDWTPPGSWHLGYQQLNTFQVTPA